MLVVNFGYGEVSFRVALIAVNEFDFHFSMSDYEVEVVRIV